MKKIIFLFLSLSLCLTQPRSVIARNYATRIASNPMFYEEKNFQSAIRFASKIKVQKNIQAVIVPHHLLASRYIAGMFKQASGRQIKTVVIVGPNHRNIGKSPIASVATSWDTAFGQVEADQKLVDKFLNDLDLKSELEVFQEEHSIGAIVPFVKYYLPRAKIMPIVLSSYADENDVKKISGWMAKNLPKQSLVIESTDFSHYLSHTQALQKDEITKQMITKPDINKILSFNNDNIDSPASLALLSLYSSKLKLRPLIVYHDDSFDLLSIKPRISTSYFGVKYVSNNL